METAVQRTDGVTSAIHDAAAGAAACGYLSDGGGGVARAARAAVGGGRAPDVVGDGLGARDLAALRLRRLLYPQRERHVVGGRVLVVEVDGGHRQRGRAQRAALAAVQVGGARALAAGRGHVARPGLAALGAVSGRDAAVGVAAARRARCARVLHQGGLALALAVHIAVAGAVLGGLVPVGAADGGGHVGAAAVAEVRLVDGGEGGVRAVRAGERGRRGRVAGRRHDGHLVGGVSVRFEPGRAPP